MSTVPTAVRRPVSALLALILPLLVVLAAPPAGADADSPHPNLTVSARIAIGSGWSTMTPRFGGDFTLDGIPDLVSVTGSGALMLYPGRTATTYSAPIQIGTGWQSFDWLALADFTSDGRADVIARHNDGTLWLYTNRNGTALAAGVKIGQGWGAFRALVLSPSGPHARPVIYALDHNTLYRYAGNGSGGISGSASVGTGWSSIASIANADDLDRNGVSDLLAVDNQGIARLYAVRPSTGAMTAWRLGHGFSGFRLGVITMPDGATHLRGAAASGALYSWPLTWTGYAATTNLFAYGTLMRGQRNAAVLDGRYVSYSRTSMAGLALYQASGYPSPWTVVQSGYVTQGEVYRLPTSTASATIAYVDRFEGYDPSKPATNQSYVRVWRPLASGGYGWVYIAGPSTAEWLKAKGSIIPTGDWRRR